MRSQWGETGVIDFMAFKKVRKRAGGMERACDWRLPEGNKERTSKVRQDRLDRYDAHNYGTMAIRIPSAEQEVREGMERGASFAKYLHMFTKAQKEKDLMAKQLEELRAFDEELRHFADQRITLDLDDGVKINYGKFGNLLAERKAITGEKG